MIVTDAKGLPSSNVEDVYVADALECINLKFVRRVEDIDEAEGFAPEYVHQHFGDSEKIFGYKNLSLTIVYSEASMNVLPIVHFDEKINEEEEGAKADDIFTLLKAQLPEEQLKMQVDTNEEMRLILSKEDNFKPFGELITKFTIGNREFEMFRIDESTPEFDDYLARVQTLSLWYINASDYTDNTDPKWMHYFLYCSKPRTDGLNGRMYSLAGYASFYRFYAYPEQQRTRLAQILILPQFRRNGLGASLLQRIYKDLISRPEITDITLEDPADNCVLLRDYIDCLNCSKLPEFAPSKLREGYSREMSDAAKKAFKICKRQSRRIYEILRLKSTNRNDKEAMKATRLDIKMRLDIPLHRTEKEWAKIHAALTKEEAQAVVASTLSNEERIEKLQKQYEELEKEYRLTIERMNIFPTIA